MTQRKLFLDGRTLQPSNSSLFFNMYATFQTARVAGWFAGLEDINPTPPSSSNPQPWKLTPEERATARAEWNRMRLPQQRLDRPKDERAFENHVMILEEARKIETKERYDQTADDKPDTTPIEGPPIDEEFKPSTDDPMPDFDSTAGERDNEVVAGGPDEDEVEAERKRSGEDDDDESAVALQYERPDVSSGELSVEKQSIVQVYLAPDNYIDDSGLTAVEAAVQTRRHVYLAPMVNEEGEMLPIERQLQNPKHVYVAPDDGVIDSGLSDLEKLLQNPKHVRSVTLLSPDDSHESLSFLRSGGTLMAKKGSATSRNLSKAMVLDAFDGQAVPREILSLLVGLH